MSELTRRSLLGGAAAASATFSFGAPADAATPAAGKLADGANCATLR